MSRALQEPRFREAGCGAAGDDDDLEDLDVDQTQRIAETCGYGLIGLGRFGDAARVLGCARITAAAFCFKASFTTSRG